MSITYRVTKHVASEEAHQDRLRQRHEEDQRRPADGAISREGLIDQDLFIIKLDNDGKIHEKS